MSDEDDPSDQEFSASETFDLELMPMTQEEMALLLSKPKLPPGHPERLDPQ
jgi:hypothetical protein